MEGGSGSYVTYKGRVNGEDVDIEGYYLGISYHGNTTDNMFTRLLIIRKDNGRVAEVYPTAVTFIEVAAKQES